MYTFDKVWHDGIIYKLKAYGIEGELLSLLKNYLENRERVVLIGQTSGRGKLKSRDPEGSVLLSLLFLIYMHNLPDEMNSLCKIFADDTSPFSKVNKSIIKLSRFYRFINLLTVFYC